MSVEVQAVHQVTDELVDAAGRLLSQLSKSAAPLDAEGLARIASHQAITLFVARSQDVIVGMAFASPRRLRSARRWRSRSRSALKCSSRQVPPWASISRL